MNQADVAGSHTGGAVVRGRRSLLGDVSHVLTFERAGHLALQAQSQGGVDISTCGPVGIEHVGPGLQYVVSQRLQCLCGLLGGDADVLLKYGIFVEVLNLIGELHVVTELLECTLNIGVLHVLADRGHTLGERSSCLLKSLIAPEDGGFGAVAGKGLHVQILFQNQIWECPHQKSWHCLSRCTRGNVSVDVHGLPPGGCSPAKFGSKRMPGA